MDVRRLHCIATRVHNIIPPKVERFFNLFSPRIFTCRRKLKCRILNSTALKLLNTPADVVFWWKISATLLFSCIKICERPGASLGYARNSDGCTAKGTSPALLTAFPTPKSWNLAQLEVFEQAYTVRPHRTCRSNSTSLLKRVAWGCG